jgi:hypothetical protein
VIDALESVQEGETVQVANEVLWSAFASQTFGASRAVYDAMIESGQLGMISNYVLRETLAGWPSRVEDATENDWQIRNYWDPLITQRLIQDVSVPQIFDSLSCEPDDYQGQCANKNSQLKHDTEVVGVLMMKYLYLKEAEKEYGLLSRYTNEISVMIAEELAPH